jgi:hypothetical protein
MKTIAFGLYNQINNRSESYQEHIRGITNFAVNLQIVSYNWTNKRNASLIVSNNIDDILTKANVDKPDYAYVVAYGYRSYNERLVTMMINHAEANGYSVLAHILEDNPKEPLNGFYSLNNQCFLINMEHWRNAGCPRFGRHETASTELPLVLRSSGNFHDDYTPYEIKPTGQTRQYTGQLRDGWNLASTMIKNGCSIGNFPDEIRNLKQHIYPEVGTELEQLLAGDTSVQVVEYNQKRYIDLMDFSGFQGSVYVFNTDSMAPDNIPYNKNTKLDSIYCVAAGFKPIQLMNQCNWDSNTQMVYFDYSDSALAFKKWLIETWDGRDYLGAVNKYQTEVDTNFRPIWFVGRDYTPEWNNTMEYFGGEQAWLELWDKYRKLPHKFLKTNLYSDYHDLVGDMNKHPGNNLIWFSNSFYTEASLRHFRPSELKALYEKFIADLKASNNSLQICGTTDTGSSAWQHIGQIQ